MSKEKYGFVYIWRDKKRNMYYIGCHWGSVDDGYICSSDWMRKAYRRRPNDFKRRILKNGITDRAQIYIEEQRYFSMIKQEELKFRYYNLRLNTVKVPWHMNEHSRLTVGQKISAAKKGKTTGPCSPEKAKKISEAKKGFKMTDEQCKNISNSKKGTVRSDESKRKTSETMKATFQENGHHLSGTVRPDEVKLKTSQTLKGKMKGTMLFNDGTVEKRFREDPGEGWTRGKIKRS
jgi:hypothetical protein